MHNGKSAIGNWQVGNASLVMGKIDYNLFESIR